MPLNLFGRAEQPAAEGVAEQPVDLDSIKREIPSTHSDQDEVVQYDQDQDHDDRDDPFRNPSRPISAYSQINLSGRPRASARSVDPDTFSYSSIAGSNRNNSDLEVWKTRLAAKRYENRAREIEESKKHKDKDKKKDSKILTNATLATGSAGTTGSRDEEGIANSTTLLMVEQQEDPSPAGKQDENETEKDLQALYEPTSGNKRRTWPWWWWLVGAAVLFVFGLGLGLGIGLKKQDKSQKTSKGDQQESQLQPSEPATPTPTMSSTSLELSPSTPSSVEASSIQATEWSEPSWSVTDTSSQAWIESTTPAVSSTEWWTESPSPSPSDASPSPTSQWTTEAWQAQTEANNGDGLSTDWNTVGMPTPGV
ncbi:uncharacterized protein JCM15063_006289 [Sporobolomyces koalae]|uniref:uncharacterized protein n=1 Tax=Sporobolomyces koalae TaxID=500713 RepID=UPI00316EC692